MSHDWPASGLERVFFCPACGNERRRVLHADLKDCVYGAPGTWTLQRCTGCGSAYLDPRPTCKMLPLAYESYHTHNPSLLSAGPERTTWAQRIKRAFLNGYLNKRFGCELGPSSRLGWFVVRCCPARRIALECVWRCLPRTLPGGLLLDVGSGNGEFLMRARTLGWTVKGIEPDPVARAQAMAQGLDVLPGAVEDLLAGSERFDVITLSHVIEHVHDPRRMLKCIHVLLKPGGMLFLETPNIESYGHQRFGSSWRGLEPPRHLVLLNRGSLEKMLRETGFDEVVFHTNPRVSLSTQSRAIKTGKDPEQARPTLQDRWTAYVTRLRLLWNPWGSEFLDAVAIKRRERAQA